MVSAELFSVTPDRLPAFFQVALERAQVRTNGILVQIGDEHDFG
jgi:hypothetical protein